MYGLMCFYVLVRAMYEQPLGCQTLKNYSEQLVLCLIHCLYRTLQILSANTASGWWVGRLVCAAVNHIRESFYFVSSFVTLNIRVMVSKSSQSI
jgi:hypothetical protein